MTTSSLARLDSAELNFRETGIDARWISCQRFTANRPLSERELLLALIANPWYDHTYAEPLPASPSHRIGIHGPYTLRKITPDSFVEVDQGSSYERVGFWARELGELPAPFESKIRALLIEYLPPGDALFELPNLRPDAEHSWGGVVGVHGFHEFVSISPDRRRLRLLVASDD